VSGVAPVRPRTGLRPLAHVGDNDRRRPALVPHHAVLRSPGGDQLSGGRWQDRVPVPTVTPSWVVACGPA
jgi:hypothetical protein